MLAVLSGSLEACLSAPSTSNDTFLCGPCFGKVVCDVVVLGLLAVPRASPRVMLCNSTAWCSSILPVKWSETDFQAKWQRATEACPTKWLASRRLGGEKCLDNFPFRQPERWTLARQGVLGFARGFCGGSSWEVGMCSLCITVAGCMALVLSSAASRSLKCSCLNEAPRWVSEGIYLHYEESVTRTAGR